MRYVELICRAASAAFEGEARLGVRLSPVELTPEEAVALAETARALLGERAYVAVAVPTLAPREEARLCLAPGDRAAEVATRWRNELSPGEGDRVLYVSAQRLGKAGGLQDTLYPLDEARLRDAFEGWDGGEESWLPPGFCAALREAGVIERLSARELCGYSEEFQRRGAGREDWTCAGALLPLLGLAADSALSAQDALARIGGNWRLVQSAAAGAEGSRKFKATSEGARQLQQALTSRLADTHLERAEQLKDVNIGALETTELERPAKVTRAPAAPRPEARPVGRPPKAAASKPRATPKTTAGDAPAVVVSEEAADTSPRVDPGERAPDPSVATPRGDEEAPSPRDDASLDDLSEGWPPAPEPEPTLEPAPEPEPEPAPTPEPAPKATRRTPTAWFVDLYKEEAGAIKQSPAGLRELVVALLEGDGEGIQLNLTRGPLRPLLQSPLKQAGAVTRRAATPRGEESPELEGALRRWRVARRALTEQLDRAAQRDPRVIDRLIQAPVIAMIKDDLRANAEALVEAAAALFVVAREDARLTRAEKLALANVEVALIEADDGHALALLGPLHPLVLGQALARLKVLQESARLSMPVKRALVRSLAQAPAAPRAWPVGERALWLSQGYGQVFYESSPTDISDEDLCALSSKLLRRYLDLHPHANLGVSVMVEGACPAAMLRGFGQVLASDARISALEVSLGAPLEEAPDPNLQRLIEEGRARLRPTPADRDAARPHLIIHLPARDAEPAERLALSDEAPAQRGGVGALQTRFELSRDGLVTHTDVAGVLGLEEVEALLSVAQGRHPTGRFTAAEEATRLSSIFPAPPAQPLTWQVAIGARLSRRARPRATLLTFDPVGERARVAVLTDSLAAVTRALEASFQLIGVKNMLPATLRNLSERLARSGNRGLCSLVSQSEQLVAAELLGLWMRGQNASTRGLVAHILEANYRTLLGADPGGDPWGAFALGAWLSKGALKLTLGYAALKEALPLGVDKEQRPYGELADRLRWLLALVHLAAQGGDEVGPALAREALGWLLWPALAAEQEPLPPLMERLRTLDQGAKISVELACLLPAGHRLLSPPQALTLEGHPLRLICIDERMLEETLMDAQMLDL